MCVLKKLAVVVSLACISAEVDWLEPNIVSGGEGWKKVQTVFDPPPFPPHDPKWSTPDASLVVLIAALRETRCPATLHSLFSKAEFPSRIHMAVVQQNAPQDEDCLAAYCELVGTPIEKDAAGEWVNTNCERFDQIRMMRMDASEAKGPVFARGKQAELVRDSDEFCMQIDAHTDVVQSWDTKIMAQWGSTENEYAVLSTYPTNVHDLETNSNKHWEMPHMCGAGFESFGTVRNSQAAAAANLEVPVLSPLWAAGLSFSRCHAERNVPNDVNLVGVFSGEEFSRGARLWTHGYDFYSITRPILGTYYGGEKGGMGSFHVPKADLQESRNRMATLLQWPNSNQSPEYIASLGQYVVGTRRSLAQYAAFSGVDCANQKIVRTCDNLTYVPWNDKSSKFSEYAPALNAPALNQRYKHQEHNQITGREHATTEEEEHGLAVLVLACTVCVLFAVLIWLWFLTRGSKMSPNSKYQV